MILSLALMASLVTPPACTAPEFHQFDFWIGDWTVTGPKGAVVGTNTVDRPFSSCVLQEHWIGAGGVHGSSFNIYDATRKQWHQTWVDDGGTLLLLNGSFAGGAMTLTGTTIDATGAAVLNRIVWRQENGDPNRVRQVWDTSMDSGATWKNTFNGLYTRKRAPHPH